MAEHGATIKRVINGGGIPQTNPVLNQVYANVLGRPILVPRSKVTSLGSAIFAFLAAGIFKTVEEAQDNICPQYMAYEPEPGTQSIYDQLYSLYRRIYFDFGSPERTAFGHVLPELIRIAGQTQQNSSADAPPHGGLSKDSKR